MIEEKLDIDKSSWDKVCFGDVVKEVRATSQNPLSEGLERLVGLEHIDSENIHIKRWGCIKNGTTFNKKFAKGQILFGRRRAYLKKAAIADFDGICSGDITVMEVKQGLLPKLLPFIVSSDKFFNHAIKNSAGSLSPRVKFDDLESFEFLLPPKDQQEKIAELLWAADDNIEKHHLLYNFFLKFRKCFIKELFNSISSKSKLEDLPLTTITGLWKTDDDQCINIRIIRSTEFSDYGEIDTSKLEPMPVKKQEFEDKKLMEGDIIVERSGGGPDQPVGRVCYFNLDENDFSFSNFTSVLRVTDEKIIIPKYLFYFLLNFYELKGTDRMQKQTTGIRNLDYDLYKRIKIPITHIVNQETLVLKIDQIERSRRAIMKTLITSKNFQKFMINQIF